MLNHKAHDVNAFTGKPVRWDFVTAHVKGESTSYVTVEGEWAVSALIRSKPEWVAAGLTALPISNDEGDPMVGWETPEDWRGDARYAASECVCGGGGASAATCAGRMCSGAEAPRRAHSLHPPTRTP